MTQQKPDVWLRRQGRYYVELGEAEKGYLIRLDNVLQGMGEHEEKLRDNLRDLRARKGAILTELEKKEDYTDKIAACRERIAQLDKKLGVDQQ
jgi:hypothetical protein